MSESVAPVDKAGKKPGTFAKGFDARRNLTIPGPGRPRDWIKERCDELLASTRSWKQVEKILCDGDHPMFATMWGKVADRAHGKPVESKEVRAEITHRVVVEVVGE